MDLQMLVGPGGRERTRDEYASLFDAAGLRVVDTVRAGELAIYEDVPT
jgi:hypothetical protein